MSHKAFVQVSVLVLILLAFLAIPSSVQAWGGCGSTYTVQWGDTLDMIAWRCGTTVSALYAANPGITGYLYAGQVLMMPGSNYNNYCNCPPVSSYNYPPANYNYPAVSYNGTYVVQFGDTFAGIASRYGVSMNDLWAANPQIWDINVLYVGQVIYVPASAGQAYYPPPPDGQVYYYAPGSVTFAIVPTPTETPTALSYGTVPPGTPTAKIRLANKSNGDVYVSLQGTLRDGSDIINEYPVSGGMVVKEPAGWYTYVAWVGGQQFVGQFNLGGGMDRTITFYNNKVVVE